MRRGAVRCVGWGRDVAVQPALLYPPAPPHPPLPAAAAAAPSRLTLLLPRARVLQVFGGARKAGYLPADRTVRIDHVGFGLVMGDDGKKFRSRSGDVSELASAWLAACVCVGSLFFPICIDHMHACGAHASLPCFWCVACCAVARAPPPPHQLRAATFEQAPPPHEAPLPLGERAGACMHPAPAQKISLFMVCVCVCVCLC